MRVTPQHRLELDLTQPGTSVFTDWQVKAARHAKRVLAQVVCDGSVELGQVQADELSTKTQASSVWIATAMSVFSRLWLWGAIGWERDERQIEQVVAHVRAAAQWGRPILWAVDGFRATPKVILKVFRDPHYRGKVGRPRLVVWDDLHIVQVVKEWVGKRLIRVSRRVAYGCVQRAEEVMQASQVLLGSINTASIERLDATLRTWMPAWCGARAPHPAHANAWKLRCFGPAVCTTSAMCMPRWMVHPPGRLI